MSKTTDQARQLLDEMASNNCDWPDERQAPVKIAGKYNVDPMLALTAQMAALTRQISELTTKGAPSSQEKAMATNVAFTEEEENSEQCQFVGNRNFNYRPPQDNIFRPNNNLPPHYHPGLRNHENFSYGNQRNAIIPPGPSQPIGERKPSLEENLNSFITEVRGKFKQQDGRLDNLETHCTNMNATMKSLEMQVGQIAQSFKGKNKESFPSDTEPNPRQCNVVTLRSRKVIGDSKEKKRDDDEGVKEGNKKEEQEKMIECRVAFMISPLEDGFVHRCF